MLDICPSHRAGKEQSKHFRRMFHAVFEREKFSGQERLENTNIKSLNLP